MLILKNKVLDREILQANLFQRAFTSIFVHDNLSWIDSYVSLSVRNRLLTRVVLCFNVDDGVRAYQSRINLSSRLITNEIANEQVAKIYRIGISSPKLVYNGTEDFSFGATDRTTASIWKDI